MASMVRRLFWMDFRCRIRNNGVLLTLVALVIVYGFVLYLNLPVYCNLKSDGVYLKVPRLEPVKTYSFFGYFTSEEDGTDKVELGTGYLLIPDRYEDPGMVTSAGRLSFLILAVIMILFANNETTEYTDKNLYRSLLLTPLGKKDLFRAKLLTGAVVVVLALVLQTVLAGLLLRLMQVEFKLIQYHQIALTNLMHGLMLYLIYVLTLAIGAVEKEAGTSLLYSLLALVILVYLLPVAYENFRNAIFYQLPKAWRGEWYWISRYLAVIDPFGSFGTFTSEILFLERAQMFYSSLPWSHSAASEGTFTIWKLLQLNWFKPLGIMLWIIGIWIGAERRMTKKDAE